jgi:GT2 family glycosyltransferase
LLIRNFVPMSSAVMRREVFDKAGPFDTTLARSEDLDFWLRAALDFGFDYVSEPLVLHRKWAAQLTSNKAKVWESNLRIQERFLREHPEVVAPQDQRRGWAIRYTGRGRVYAAAGRRLAASREFLRALCFDFRYQPAVRELLKLLVPRR